MNEDLRPSILASIRDLHGRALPMDVSHTIEHIFTLNDLIEKGYVETSGVDWETTQLKLTPKGQDWLKARFQ